MFKFQNHRIFLKNFEDCLLEILRLPDQNITQLEQLYLRSNVNGLLQKTLEGQVRVNLIVDVKINTLIYKKRCIEYSKKIYKLYETNFLKPHFGLIEEIGEYLDPYK